MNAKIKNVLLQLSSNGKIVGIFFQVCFAFGMYALSLWMRRHLPAGAEAGWFRGALDGMNAMFYMFDSKETFMSHPHTWGYTWFYWPNAIFACYSWSSAVNSLSTSKPPVSPADLSRLASEVNAKCPWQLDEVTRLDAAVVGEGLTLIYRYTLTTDGKPSADQIAELNEHLTRNLSAQWTPDFELTKLYDAGVQFLYEYRDREEDLVLTVRQKK